MESDKNETENNIEDQGTDVKETKEIPEMTTEELQAAINGHEKGNSADINGIRAEDITRVTAATVQGFRRPHASRCSGVLLNSCCQSLWQKTRFKVTLKMLETIARSAVCLRCTN